jgi:hypothetical protein
MKTSDSIEQAEERKRQTKESTPLTPADRKRYARGPYKKHRPGSMTGKHPNSHTPRGYFNHGPDRNPKIRPTQWKPGQSGNPSGRISDKKDIAKQIARAVFERNQEALYNAFADAALKGNAYCFQQLADRAYGKIRERVEYEFTELHDVPTSTLEQQLADLEQKLGYTRTDRLTGTSRQDSSRIIPASLEKEN